jgi:hypothetical protein
MMISGQLKNYPGAGMPDGEEAECSCVWCSGESAVMRCQGISGFFSPLRNKYSKLKLNSEVLNESL